MNYTALATAIPMLWFLGFCKDSLALCLIYWLEEDAAFSAES